MGTSSYLAPYSQWVGGGQVFNGQQFGIPRTSVSFVTTSQLALQWFSLLDDIVFDTTGSTPGYGYPLTVAAPNTFERNNDFTWAYMMRRPLSGDPTVAEVTVVAYYKRSLALNSSLQGDEAAFSAVFNPDTNDRDERHERGPGSAVAAGRLPGRHRHQRHRRRHGRRG
jgi:hypothetical protein